MQNMKGAVDKIRKGDEEPDEEDEEAKKNKGDQRPARIVAFVDGRASTILMTLMTLAALWGDDLKLATFDKSADGYWEAIFTFSFILFLGEFLLNTIAKEDYKYGFFFVLDLCAALSCLSDVPWLTDAIIEAATRSSAGESEGLGGASLGQARTARVVRLVRLIRLIRIVKLYSMLRKAKESDAEEQLKAAARAAVTQKQAALKRVEASRLGTVLSQKTTRRVVIMVLAMVMLTPNLTYNDQNTARITGLSNLFWFGRSNCAAFGVNSTVFHCDLEAQRQEPWLNEEGWNFMLYEYTNSHLSEFHVSFLAGYKRSVLWLYIADLNQDGNLREITTIESQGRIWKSDPRCRDWVVKDRSCPFRNNEMETVVYAPVECSGWKTSQSCETITVGARFEFKQMNQADAVMNMLRTLMVCIVLGVMSIFFQNDTQSLVIAPIEKMVNIIKQLAEDPLRRPEQMVTEDDLDAPAGGKGGNQPQLETTMLENTIMKIGGLLQVGFGQAGSAIIGKNMSSGDGELNIMMPGNKVDAIFGAVHIASVAEITVGLQEDVVVFINTVTTVIHECVARWSGVANKHLGNIALVCWYLPVATKKNSDVGSKVSDLSDRALLSFIKILAEAKRSDVLSEYKEKKELTESMGEFDLTFTFGLHCGWAIEGPIGSDYKVDASYLSPNVNIAQALQKASRLYHCNIVLSEPFYRLCSLRTKQCIRKVDVVLLGSKVGGIYIFPLSNHSQGNPPSKSEILYAESGEHAQLYDKGLAQPPNKALHQMGDVIKPVGLEVASDLIERDGVEFLFLVDQDVAYFRVDMAGPLYGVFRKALCEYTQGAWEKSEELLLQCLELDENDGPTYVLLDFIRSYSLTPPKDWAGYRTNFEIS